MRARVIRAVVVKPVKSRVNEGDKDAVSRVHALAAM